MSLKRWACGLAAVTLTTLGLVSTASATTGNQLHISGPFAVGPGASYTITTSGFAVSPANEVVAWSTTKACKLGTAAKNHTDAYTQELAAMGSAAPALKNAVKGTFQFGKALTAPKSTSTVTEYWCAYLINSSTRHTYKSLQFKYTVLGQGGGPGGP